MKPFSSKFIKTAALFGVALAELGCSSGDIGSPSEPAYETTTLALDASTIIGTYYDDSASPVHIQIRSCKTSAASVAPQVDCRVDPEYALVGGGATPAGTNGAKPFITESRPVDGRTWRATSKEASSQGHELTVHAIGMRLDGVNTQTLRESIEWKTGTTTGQSVTKNVDSDAALLGGGARTERNAGVTGHRVLTTLAPPNGSSWKVEAKPLSGSVAATTEVTLLQIDKKVIEGFGKLEVMQMSGSARSTSGGSHSTTLSVPQGWALMSMGAVAQTSGTGSPRMITGITPCTTGRCVTVTTGDTNGARPGTTIPYAMLVRKMPASHGLCNPGNALNSGTDSCVASICAARSQCCTSSWDSTCVDMVETKCGRSCDEHTCVPTVFEPEKWTQPDGTAVASNCYYYAQNKYPDGEGMDPGSSLNLEEGDLTAPRLAALAAGDGLIPSTHGAACTENRTKVMLTTNSSVFNYHWYRQDTNGLWSEKFATWGQAQIKENTGYRPYTDVQNNTYEAFFCACNQALPSTP